MKSGVSVAANLRKWLKSQPLLSASYDETEILLFSPTLLLPDDDFEPSDAEVLYKYTFSAHDRDIVRHCVLPDQHAVVVFGIDKDLYMVVADHFATCHWMPVCLPVWRHFGKRNREHDRSHSRLHVYLHDGYADVFSFSGSHFKFSNSFAATHAKDALYYVLNAFTQQGMKASRDEVMVLGSMANKRWLVQQLQTYVKSVNEPELPVLDTNSPHPSSIPTDLILMTTP